MYTIAVWFELDQGESAIAKLTRRKDHRQNHKRRKHLHRTHEANASSPKSNEGESVIAEIK
jgi:hypothetical protein